MYGLHIRLFSLAVLQCSILCCCTLFCHSLLSPTIASKSPKAWAAAVLIHEWPQYTAQRAVMHMMRVILSCQGLATQAYIKSTHTSLHLLPVSCVCLACVSSHTTRLVLITTCSKTDPCVYAPLCKPSGFESLGLIIMEGPACKHVSRTCLSLWR